MAEKARRHDHGRGRCSACNGVLCVCPGCGRRSLHKIDGEYLCESGCTPRARIQEAWRAEMRAALARVR